MTHTAQGPGIHAERVGGWAMRRFSPGSSWEQQDVAKTKQKALWKLDSSLTIQITCTGLKSGTTALKGLIFLHILQKQVYGGEWRGNNQILESFESQVRAFRLYPEGGWRHGQRLWGQPRGLTRPWEHGAGSQHPAEAEGQVRHGRLAQAVSGICVDTGCGVFPKRMWRRKCVHRWADGPATERMEDTVMSQVNNTRGKRRTSSGYMLSATRGVRGRRERQGKGTEKTGSRGWCRQPVWSQVAEVGCVEATMLDGILKRTHSDKLAWGENVTWTVSSSEKVKAWGTGKNNGKTVCEGDEAWGRSLHPRKHHPEEKNHPSIPQRQTR